MTDHLSDLLDRAADDALWTPPSPADDLALVRAASHRQRLLRRTGLAAGVAVAGVAAATAIVIGVNGLPGGGDDDGDVADEPPSQVIDYTDRHDGLGVQIDDPSDVSKLDGATSDFRDFMVDALADADEDCDDVEGTEGGIVTVLHLRTGSDGVAVGSVGGCGGAVAFWAVVDGQWRQVAATQDVVGCGVLYRYDFPGSFVGGECVQYRGDKQVHPYPRD